MYFNTWLNLVVLYNEHGCVTEIVEAAEHELINITMGETAGRMEQRKPFLRLLVNVFVFEFVFVFVFVFVFLSVFVFVFLTQGGLI